MKKFLSLVLLIISLISCQVKSEKDNVAIKKTNEPNLRYIVNSKIDGKSNYLYIEDGNDTIFLHQDKAGIDIYPKILGTKESFKKIKETINYHLDIDNFHFYNNLDTVNRNWVRFSVESSNNPFFSSMANTVESIYWGINRSADVSQKYDSLFKFLKRENEIFKDW